MVSKKEQSKILYIVVGIAALALIGNQMSWWIIPGIPKFSTGGAIPSGGQQTIDETMRSNYLNGVGKFQLDATCKDSLDIATARTIATNLDIAFWHFIGGQWIHETTKTVSGTEYFDAQLPDNGYMWFSVEAKSAQAFYVDYLKIKGSDSYIKSYTYTDVDGDGTREFTFQYDLRNHAIPSNGYPIIGVKTFLLTYDGSFALANLANATSIGTSTTTKYYEEYCAVSAEKKAAAAYKIEWKVTTTDETKIRFKSMTIPNVGKVDVSQFTKDMTSTDIKWSYSFGSSFDGANLLTRPQMSLGKLYFTTEIEYTLGGSDDILTTFTVYYLIAPTEAGSSVTDTFYVQA